MTDTTPTPAAADPDYCALFDQVAAVIADARAEAVRRTNAVVIDLHWRIGRLILERQRGERYGSRLISRLSVDLTAQFGGAGSWSPRNLRYMRAFARAWPSSGDILQPRLQNVSWRHHQVLLDLVEGSERRRWYLEQAVTNRWSSRVLRLQISGRLHERVGQAPSNFSATLPDTDGDLLAELATDPRRLDFLTLDGAVDERSVEAALVARITEFLTHLGRGFAYVGRQFRLTVDDSDFFLDLLFFNTELNCYVIFELKVRSFTPGDAGQLAFYITAIERHLRRAHHGPTIGVLLVPDKSNVIVEYALATISAPMAVATYASNDLPPRVRDVLPAPDELAHAIHDIAGHETDT